MTLLRGAEIDRYLAAPDKTRPIALLFGPDSGAVTERASILAERLANGDPMAVTRFDEADLVSEPDRLANEVYAGSLFSGVRVMRIRAGGNRSIAPTLTAITNDPPDDTWIIVEAGDLRKTAPLRKVCETSPRAAAIGCYPDNDAALGRLIDSELATINATIDRDAREALVALLGSDRGASRSEIQKLGLFVGSGGTVTADAVATIIGDGGAFAIDDVVDAASLGDQAKLDRGMRRILASGASISTVAIAVERHFLQLHALKAAIQSGKPASAAIQAMRPPVFPSRRALIERQLRLWHIGDLADALVRINDAVMISRLQPAIATATISRVLVGLSARASQQAKRQA